MHKKEMAVQMVAKRNAWAGWRLKGERKVLGLNAGNGKTWRSDWGRGGRRRPRDDPGENRKSGGQGEKHDGRIPAREDLGSADRDQRNGNKGRNRFIRKALRRRGRWTMREWLAKVGALPAGTRTAERPVKKKVD